jgi:Na+/melibiose symporter-like transporter
VVDAGELLIGKRLSGGCSALMTFARKTGAAIVINIFTTVLTLTGYDSEAAVQTPAAQNGIKYVMAFTCIAFMVLGFIMAKRYVLSKKVNEKVEKFLPISREGRLAELSEDEAEELCELKKAIS